VANGALAWYIDNPISARVSKHHYGVEISIPFDPNMPDMAHRVPFRNKQGEMRVESAWHSIVAKVSFIYAGHYFYLIVSRTRSYKPVRRSTTHIVLPGAKIKSPSDTRPNYIYIEDQHLGCSLALLVWICLLRCPSLADVSGRLRIALSRPGDYMLGLRRS
jgi:hypothetical protein